MRRILRLGILAALMVLSLCSFASAKEVSGDCGAEGGNVTWVMDTESGCLTVSGTGDMASWGETESPPWLEYMPEIRRVVIEEGVTYVGDYAFILCENLQQAELADTLEEIGAYAFAGTALETVEIPDNVVYIGLGAFQACWNLQTVSFPEELEWIGMDAFWGCVSLQEVEIPGSVYYIDWYAFQECVSLKTVKIGEGVEYIGYNAFLDCASLEELYLPATLSVVEEDAFAGADRISSVYYGGSSYDWAQVIMEKGNSSIHIADIVCAKGDQEPTAPLCGSCGAEGSDLRWELDRSTQTLHISGTGMMADWEDTDAPWKPWAKEIRYLAIEKGVENIGAGAFRGCTNLGINSGVELPSGLVWIGEEAFLGCRNLMWMDWYGSGEVIGDCAFMGCYNLRSVILPQTLKVIGNGAFSGCSYLYGLHALPEKLQVIGEEAFYDCDMIMISEIPASVEVLGARCFYGCYGISELEISGKVETIPGGAFQNCGELREVKLNGGTAVIGEEAFAGCEQLETVTLPQTLREIGESAFADTVVELVHFGGTEEEWNALTVEKGNDPLTALIPGKQIRFRSGYAYGGSCGWGGDPVFWSFDPERRVLTISGEGAMADVSPWKAVRDLITAVVIEEGVTSVGSNLFGDCPKLMRVEMADSVREIRDFAFDGCRKLTEITISKGVERIGTKAFSNCTSLESIRLPGNVKEVGSSAFEGCAALKEVKMEDGVERIAHSAFSECVALERVEIPNSVTVIEMYAFSGCTALTEVRLPENLKVLEMAVLGNCAALKRVVIPEGVEKIERYALMDCIALTEVTIPVSVKEIDWNAFDNTGLKTVYYSGTAQQWKTITINPENDALVTAQIHYESDGAAQVFISGTVRGGSGAKIKIGTEETTADAEGGFRIAASAGTVDVTMKLGGCLTHTVKNVTVGANGVELPEIIPVRGDVNGDDMINIMDMAAFRQNFGKTGEAILNPYTDTNGDGMVNIMDMGTFRQNFGKTAPRDATVEYAV